MKVDPKLTFSGFRVPKLNDLEEFPQGPGL
jgi:hypothetical protein